MDARKTPLRPGLGYPLRASVLEAALVQAGVRTPVVLHQRTETWWTEGVLFRADFHAPAPPGGRAEKGEVLHVTCRSVPSDERRAARRFLETDAIPALIEWISAFEALPADSTVKRERPSFIRSWPSGADAAQIRAGAARRRQPRRSAP